MKESKEGKESIERVNRQQTTDNGQRTTDNGQQTLNLIHSRRLILLHPEVTLATSGRSNCYIATNQKKALFVVKEMVSVDNNSEWSICVNKEESTDLDEYQRLLL